ncbi:MAG: hypothetical protein V1717_00535 [Candidatus Micrarchaeota archaeon]
MQASKRAEKKSQVFALDLIIALVVFLSVIGVFTAWRDSLNSRNVQAEEFQRASLKASEAAFILLETPGDPLGWNASNVKQVGLALERNVVGRKRLANFLNLTYANATKLLGVGAYDFYFELRFLNGTLVGVNESGIIANASLGNLYDNYSLQVPLRKPVLYNNEQAVLFLRLAR